MDVVNFNKLRVSCTYTNHKVASVVEFEFASFYLALTYSIEFDLFEASQSADAEL